MDRTSNPNNIQPKNLQVGKCFEPRHHVVDQARLHSQIHWTPSLGIPCASSRHRLRRRTGAASGGRVAMGITVSAMGAWSWPVTRFGCEIQMSRVNISEHLVALCSHVQTKVIKPDVLIRIGIILVYPNRNTNKTTYFWVLWVCMKIGYP